MYSDKAWLLFWRIIFWIDIASILVEIFILFSSIHLHKSDFTIGSSIVSIILLTVLVYYIKSSKIDPLRCRIGHHSLK